MIQRSLAKKRSGEGGFTLIELLIVIVILGILAAIVVLAIGGLKGSSKAAACDAEAKTIETAEDAYFASTGNATNYASGAQLLSAGLLKTSPAAHFTVTGGAGTYSIVGVAAECPGINIAYP
jgi:prepilin-type N-terminal cleavage/methylation domain-containing protein